MEENMAMLNRLIAISMEIQEEYLTKPQDFSKQQMLEEEMKELKQEILEKMCAK